MGYNGRLSLKILEKSAKVQNLPYPLLRGQPLKSFKEEIEERKLFLEHHQAPVVQRMDNAIHRINRYPVDKCWRKKLRYPLDSDLSGG